jgi:transmembrane sensor
MSASLDKDSSRTARAEASAWLAQLHGSQRSAGMEADFRSWLVADPRNAQAFEKVTEVWDALGNVNVGGLPRLQVQDPFERSARSRYLPLAVAACAALAVGTWWFAKAPSYVTDTGEQRTVSLADGSRVSLNSETRIGVEYDDAKRVIRLEAGEALFEVAQHPGRPFIVLAGDRRIVALGTSFVVRREAGRLDVTLLKGKVAVSEESAAQTATGVTLTPGQRLSVLPDRTQKLDVPSPDTVIAWRRGELILDNMPLSEAIAEMNRHDRVRLVIEDAGLGHLPVSGIYRSGNNQDFAHAVATLYGLSVVSGGGTIHLRRNPLQN